jgi:hypothetical protein
VPGTLLEDPAAFADCFGGSDTTWNDPACRLFDNDADDDVDCDDWNSFRRVWTDPPTTLPRFSECVAPRRFPGRRRAVLSSPKTAHPRDLGADTRDSS